MSCVNGLQYDPISLQRHAEHHIWWVAAPGDFKSHCRLERGANLNSRQSRFRQKPSGFRDPRAPPGPPARPTWGAWGLVPVLDTTASNIFAGNLGISIAIEG